ncbi:uncharacterized protein EDB91DRAFT_570799 [Suillus paluster]|uniref:uncharacterized protein n=1 Tax=Suillus paluster TaxID=48578 RepID=UPI001B87266D|nr:uncharacterized protein EDB91DRAFT_570799 [Suillus paluster]KAG1735136.1 hypothetical protein EDB91DRAFT_570799 [Suillus paluster]
MSMEQRERRAAILTYHVGNRNFSRIFKENSLEEAKNVVQRKLQLPPGSVVKLRAARSSKTFIELDDDDDFDAFSLRAQMLRLVDVVVDVKYPLPMESRAAKNKRKATNDQQPEDANATATPQPKIKKRKTDQPAAEGNAPKHAQTPEVPETDFKEKLNAAERALKDCQDEFDRIFKQMEESLRG